MTTEQFADSLKKGLGRAHVFLRENDPVPYRDTLLSACLTDLRYDRQCEDGRAHYLYDLIRLSGDTTYYRKAVLNALANSNDEAPFQLVELAYHFAADGDAGARAALYAEFEANAARGFYDGAEEITLLDGAAGFLYALEHLPDIESGDKSWAPESWLEALEKRDGRDAVWAALDDAAAGKPGLAMRAGVVRARCETPRQRPFRTRRERPGYEEVRRLILEMGTRARISLFWGRDASEEDVRSAAADLLAETDEDRLLAYLRLFGHRRFPFDHARIIEYARHPNEGVRRRAISALKHISAPDVRALALELSTDPSRYDDAVKLLTANYEPGDEALVRRLVDELPPNPDLWHWLGMAAKQFVREHPTLEDVPVLLALYEQDPCSVCRYDIVTSLNRLGALPPWMEEEARHDANPDLRAWIEGGKQYEE